MYQVSWDLYPPPYYLEAESVVGHGLNWIHAYLRTVHGHIRIFTHPHISGEVAVNRPSLFTRRQCHTCFSFTDLFPCA